MPVTPNGPLPPHGIRLLTPEFLLVKLKQHPLTCSLYPIAMGHYPSALGHQMRRQEHHNHLLIYCTAGRGWLSCCGKTRQINAGDLILIPPGEAHRYKADQEAPWSIYWVHFAGELAAEFSKRLLMKMDNGLANVGHQPRVVADFETVLQLRDHGYTATNVIHAVHLLQQILSFLALQLRLHHPPGSKEIDLEVLEALMMEHLHTSLNLDMLAQRSNLSKYYFSKKFKVLTDSSPIEYFIHMKMQHACHLLDSGQRSVKQIGASLGYSDPYYFSRLFKKVIGMSPAQYRKDKHR